MAQTLSYVRPAFVERQRVGAVIAPAYWWATLVMGAAGIATAVVFATMLVMGVMGTRGPAVGLMVGGGAWGLWLLPHAFEVVTVVEPSLVRFGLFVGGIRLWRRVIPLAKVRACEVVRPGEVMPGVNKYRLPKQFAVLRGTMDQRYVLLTGREAVVWLMEGGDIVAVGSQRPQELVDAVRAMRLGSPEAAAAG